MYKAVRGACLILSMAVVAIGATWAGDDPKQVKLTTTADHSKFKELQREFKTGPDLTKACLTCRGSGAVRKAALFGWLWN